MTLINNIARKSIQKLVPYSSARHENRQEGVRLDANENPFWREDGFNRYPDPQPELLRQKMAEMYGVKPSQLLMTRGSDEGVDLLVRSYCESSQDAIITTPPTYGMYEVAASIQGVGVLNVPLNIEEGFSFNKDNILDQWQPFMKIIFLCSPNNPTGNILNELDILALCEALKNKALVVVDEAYIEFSINTSLSRYVSQYPNLVVLRTLSKAFGLAGIRLGSLIANQDIVSLLTKVIAPYPIPTPVVQVALKSLSSENRELVNSQIQMIRNERNSLRSFLEKLPSVKCVYPSEANFLLVKVKDAQQWMSKCIDNKVIIRLRDKLFGLRNCVRITIGTKEENKKLQEVLSYV
ncbi:MAG TPA: histidinol-phosphate transaminase [Gammaproteobacteria bacterium]|nr:histidinol-phosphate transaminase [Gammaproteobacteria bacterium]